MSGLPQMAEVLTAGTAVQLVKGIQVCATPVWRFGSPHHCYCEFLSIPKFANKITAK
jgi:hypothetical protein